MQYMKNQKDAQRIPKVVNDTKAFTDNIDRPPSGSPSRNKSGNTNLLSNLDGILTMNKKKTKSDTKEELSPDDLNELEREFYQEYDTYKKKNVMAPPNKKVLKYGYPQELTIVPVKRLKLSFGPFGTQWIHDKQYDDVLSGTLKSRAAKFDALRAIVLPEQRTPEWFAMRDGKITASDGGTVIDVNKHEQQYKFILKKTTKVPFLSNKFCYHGKKLEAIATMIYQYRMNVDVEEFGLLGHPTINFLGASPDGICSRYKYDKTHTSKFVGRMLEIKCPLVRKINTEGPIIDHICPIYYWVQVQLQLECCDLEECDFWQCDLREYESREDFLNDTDPDEPFRSKQFGFEKGCLIQLVPRDKMKEIMEGKYWDTVYEDSAHIYPPKIEMSPYDCDVWVAEQLATYQSHPMYDKYCFDKVIYWRLEKSHNVLIERDRDWFEEKLPVFKKMWDYVLFFRQNKDKLDILVQFIESRVVKNNKKIMAVIEKLYNKKAPDYNSVINSILEEIDAGNVAKQQEAEDKQREADVEAGYSNYMFVDTSGTDDPGSPPKSKSAKAGIGKKAPVTQKGDSFGGNYMFVDDSGGPEKEKPVTVSSKATVGAPVVKAKVNAGATVGAKKATTTIAPNPVPAKRPFGTPPFSNGSIKPKTSLPKETATVDSYMFVDE